MFLGIVSSHCSPQAQIAGLAHQDRAVRSRHNHPGVPFRLPLLFMDCREVLESTDGLAHLVCSIQRHASNTEKVSLLACTNPLWYQTQECCGVREMSRRLKTSSCLCWQNQIANFFQDELATVELSCWTRRGCRAVTWAPGNGRFSLNWNSSSTQLLVDGNVYLSDYGLDHVKDAFSLLVTQINLAIKKSSPSSQSYNIIKPIPKRLTFRTDERVSFVPNSCIKMSISQAGIHSPV